MKTTEERIREHLAAASGTVLAPDRLEQIMREGHRRRVTTRLGAVVGVAAAVAAVLTLAPILDSAPPPADRVADSRAVTTLPAVTTEPTAASGPLSSARPATGVLVAGPAGITMHDSGGGVARELTSDRFYEAISTAYPDQRGGIVFQHEATPLPWPQGAIMWLAAGDSEPRVLATPVEGGRLVPVGPAVSSQGHAMFVHLSDVPSGEGLETQLVATDLDTGQSTVISTLPPFSDVRVGGDVIASVDRESSDCPTLSLVRLDGTPVDHPLGDCLPVAASVAVSGDGTALAELVDGVLTVVAIADGTELSQIEIPDAYMVTAGATTDWVVRTPTKTLLVGDESQESFPVVEIGSAVPVAGDLDLGAEATLGSGTNDLPCSPTPADLEDVDLPEAVSETRAEIAAAAAACDYDTLAQLAVDNETVVTFGGGSVPDVWVHQARMGDAEPLQQMVELLAGEPEVDSQAGLYFWPAGQPDDFMGFRVVIRADGQWTAAVAGD